MQWWTRVKHKMAMPIVEMPGKNYMNFGHMGFIGESPVGLQREELWVLWRDGQFDTAPAQQDETHFNLWEIENEDGTESKLWLARGRFEQYQGQPPTASIMFPYWDMKRWKFRPDGRSAALQRVESVLHMKYGPDVRIVDTAV